MNKQVNKLTNILSYMGETVKQNEQTTGANIL